MNNIRIGTQFRSNGGPAKLIDLDSKNLDTGKHPVREIVEGEIIEYDGRFFDTIHGSIYHDNFHIVGGDGFEGQFYPHRNGIAVLGYFTELSGAKS